MHRPVCAFAHPKIILAIAGRAVSVACVSLACLSCCLPVAVAQSNQNQGSGKSLLGFLFDRTPSFKEQVIDVLPPLPRTIDLLKFEVSQTSPLTFMIDAHSVSIGTDRVLRYTVVITSPQGAHNVRYEGIRCDAYQWRAYAAANEAGADWDRQASTDWARIEPSGLNAYHAALYQDYFCVNKMPASSAKTIVNNIRYHRRLAN